MKAITRKSAFIVLGIAIFASAYFGVKARPVAQMASSTPQEQMGVPAPVQGQKKVILKNLGMT